MNCWWCASFCASKCSSFLQIRLFFIYLVYEVLFSHIKTGAIINFPSAINTWGYQHLFLSPSLSPFLTLPLSSTQPPTHPLYTHHYSLTHTTNSLIYFLLTFFHVSNVYLAFLFIYLFVLPLSCSYTRKKYDYFRCASSSSTLNITNITTITTQNIPLSPPPRGREERREKRAAVERTEP